MFCVCRNKVSNTLCLVHFVMIVCHDVREGLVMTMGKYSPFFNFRQLDN